MLEGRFNKTTHHPKCYLKNALKVWHLTINKSGAVLNDALTTQEKRREDFEVKRFYLSKSALMDTRGSVECSITKPGQRWTVSLGIKAKH